MKYTVIFGDIVFADGRAIVQRVGHIKTIQTAIPAQADDYADAHTGADDYVICELFKGEICTA